MSVRDQKVEDHYALYNGDCVELMQSIPDNSIHFSVYSPPFATGDGGLYTYSSQDQDLSNCHDYDAFFEHYGYAVAEIARVTMPGRLTAVHCTDIPSGNSGRDYMIDFPGDIIRLHEKHGFRMVARHTIWKEPLWVRNRTMTKNLAHKTVVDDSAFAGVASADYLIVFRKGGENPVPIANPVGLDHYAGEEPMPAEVAAYRGWDGDQKQNKYSHWIWRHYASSIWDDIRQGHVLPYQESKEDDDEKHVHPLQLDVIDRAINLRSNVGETVLSPFAGVGSEPYVAVANGRKAIGVELKESYYKQMVKNMEEAEPGSSLEGEHQIGMFDDNE